jgi:hypothetical protein
VEGLDPSQLALAKKGADLAEEGARNFLSKVLGSPLEEVGALLHDKVRARRFRNQVNTLVKTRDMLAEAGISPKAVPLKVLVPLLEGASLEDDESMSARWAALLANAANPNHAHAVLPACVAILKELTPTEARMLDSLAGETRFGPWKRMHRVSDFARTYQLSDAEVGVYTDNLLRHRLIENPPMDFRSYGVGVYFHLGLSDLGYAFVTACQPPAKSATP